MSNEATSPVAGPETGGDPWIQPVAGLLDQAGIGVWRWDPLSGKVHWDEQTEALYGLAPGTFDGTLDAYLGQIHRDDVADALALIQDVAQRGGLYSIKHRIVWPDGTVRWIEGQGRIDSDGDGTPIRGYGIVYDVTDRATLERERDDLRRREAAAVRASEASREALDFLIRAGDALAGSLHGARVAERLAHVLTDGFGDHCIIDVALDEPNRSVLTCIRNAATGAVVVEEGTALDMAHAMRRISTLGSQRLSSDGLSVMSEVDTDRLSTLLPSAPSHRIGEAIIARGRPIGSIVVGRIDRPWSAEDAALLEAIARRAAVALDHTELYRDRSAIAEMFQRSVNPGDLPSVRHLDLGVLYRPAAELARLGGDLYDTFTSDRRRWMLMVGDVCGKGVLAAGHAGLARTALRAASHATDDPAGALAVLNRTVLTEPTRPLLTMALAALEPADALGHWLVEVCCAGHPHPLIVRRSGAVESIGETGMLLGYASDAAFPTAQGRLEPGDSLILFSDGVLEARRGTEFFGSERLEAALRLVAGSPATSIADAVGATLDTWTAEAARDDVVVLVARATDAG